MAVRFHAHCPTEQKQSTGAANAKDLVFDELDSGYKVGTAGTKGVGCSATIQLLSGSEVAFWPHAETHAAVDSHSRLRLESKERMRARGAKSPDEWDAVALTFAEPVVEVAGFRRKLVYPPSGVA